MDLDSSPINSIFNMNQLPTDFTWLKEWIAPLFIWRWYPTSVYTSTCAIWTQPQWGMTGDETLKGPIWCKNSHYQCCNVTEDRYLTDTSSRLVPTPKERLYRKCNFFFYLGTLIKCLLVPSSSSLYCLHIYVNILKQSRCLNIPSGKRKKKQVFLIFQLLGFRQSSDIIALGIRRGWWHFYFNGNDPYLI